MTDAYLDFLRRKVPTAPATGFDVDLGDVSTRLPPHARAIVPWLLSGGRRALFASFGLQKTVMQLETVRLAAKHADGAGLIVLPLGVRQEFRIDAVERLGWKEPPRFIRSIDECDSTGVYLTNYETVRDGKLDPRHFAAASLDEAACLRGFGGTKTFREFMRLFAGDGKTLNERVRSTGVRFRFVATATPSPNDYIELLAYAAYLDIMDVSAAKTRFFKRDSTKADELTIHPHKVREFWLWVASWALFITKPSDLGPEYSDAGYNLPPLDLRWHEVPSDHSNAGTERDGQARLFRNAAAGVVDASREKRDSIESRTSVALEIVLDGRREVGEAPRAEPCALSGEQGEIQGQEQGLEGSQSRAVPGANGAPQSCESGNDAGAQRAVVSREQAKGCSDDAALEAQAVRDHSGAEEGNPAAAGAPVPDLSEVPRGINATGSGSRSRLRGGTRGALRPMQHGSGSVGRQHGELGTRNRVPEHRGADHLPQVVVWVDLNDEQRALERLFDAAGVSYSSLYGSQSLEEREQLLNDWRQRRTTVFLSKTSMYGAGLNLQQAHRMVFAGVHHKFHEVIQGVHRIHRFGQIHRCEATFIYTEAEREIRADLERKWTQHNEMVKVMTELVREFDLSQLAMMASLTRALGVERVEARGENYQLVNNDCVLETAAMEEASVDLILTSIPFSSQYEYSPNYADFGHSDNNAHFFEQMDYLTPQMLRVLKPGRLAAIHVKDRIVPGGMTGLGFQTVYPFHARCIEHYTRHGFAYMGMKTVVTDVVRENNQTYRLGWTEQCKDGSKMGFGMPEYLLLFRRPPSDTGNSYADDPVVKDKAKYSRSRWQVDAHAFARSNGNRLMKPEELAALPHDGIFKLFRQHSLSNVYDFEHHVRVGEALERSQRLPVTFMLLQPQSWHPDVWTDITRMLTLNGAQSAAGREMHLCPMQFDLADRAIEQWTEPGELVFDPFSGLGTVPYRALLKGRRGLGVELSARYFLDAAAYCAAAEREMSMPDLFGGLDTSTEDAAA